MVKAPIALVALVLGLVSCGGDADEAGTRASTAVPNRPATTVVEASTATTVPEVLFPVERFSAVGDDPVIEEVGAKFQAALDGLSGTFGASATVMTADGTWTGTRGKTDGLRDVVVDDQFNIGSVTKTLTAAQVMQLVEAGELGLDDLAIDHLPPDLGFDIGEVTIRDLLSHRSGLPDYWDAAMEVMSADRLRVWTPADILELVPDERGTVGRSFQYGDVNYRLLGMVVEQVRGRPFAEVLRDGVLAIDGMERLVYQPDERPTEPMAMPGGESTSALDSGGGYLPSLAAVTLDGPAGAIASDSPSLGRWWRAFCAGQIVSQASLTEMATFADVSFTEGGYGLGLYNPAHPSPGIVGHTGVALGVEHIGEYGYVAVAACLPEDGAVIVVLTNRSVRPQDNLLGILQGMVPPFIDVLHSV